MNLKHTVETKISVDYNDLDDFIREQYGQEDYEVVADMEWNNSESHEISVAKSTETSGVLYEHAQKQLNEFKATGKGQYLLRVLLQDLCDRDIIIPGDYLINVSW